MDADRLRTIPLFSDLPRKDLERLATWADEVDVPAGRPLMREGQFGHEFFVLEEGTVEVIHEGNRIRELGPGDYFGELALLEHQRRSATVVTTSPVRAIVIFEREFTAMEKAMPEVAEKIQAMIATRVQELRDAEEQA